MPAMATPAPIPAAAPVLRPPDPLLAAADELPVAAADDAELPVLVAALDKEIADVVLPEAADEEVLVALVVVVKSVDCHLTSTPYAPMPTSDRAVDVIYVFPSTSTLVTVGKSNHWLTVVLS